MSSLIERIRNAFDYNPDTGALVWKVSKKNHVKPGRVVRCAHRDGYLKLQFESRHYLAHRIIWAIAYGEWPKGEIDHINHDPADNRLSNLRVVAHTKNMQNIRLRKSGSNKIMGVRFRKKSQKWVARIGQSGKEWLGAFDNLFDAACARKSAENRLGYHPNHGRKL